MPLGSPAQALSARADVEPGRREEDLSDAETHLRAALDLLPSDSDALFSLGVLLSKRGDAAGALAAYPRPSGKSRPAVLS